MQKIKEKKDQAFEKIDQEVRAKTEALRKTKDEATNKLNPLASQAQQIQTKIDSDQDEVKIFEDKIARFKQELAQNTQQIQ